jgi:hypothetical protein
VGILKYRLYDIDRIISRTLAYAIITGLLIGVYAGLVLLATRVLSFHTPVAVAASTLAAAALFNPLRRRVQRAVDRRFNRARYDADQTVALFAARLKDAVDLDAVRDDLPVSCTKPWNPPTYRCGSANTTESGFRRLRRHQARPFYEVGLPYYAIIRRDLHQQSHDHELQLPYKPGSSFRILPFLAP